MTAASVTTSTRKPVFAIVSHTLRRDLEEPLRHFGRVRIVHLYHDASYKDMATADFASQPIRYQSSRDVARILAELQPDIVQGPEPYASRLALRNAWAVARYCRATKTPYIVPVFENVPARTKFGPLVGTIMEWFLGWYGQQAAGVITLNEGATRNLLEAGVDRGRITPLLWGTWGIDTKEFRPAPQRRSRRPTVFFVGRISAKKGLDDLLDAWDSILASEPTAQLVIGGPALDDDGAALLERIRNTPAATYVGPIKNNQLAGYFQAAWVTVAPSVSTTRWVEQVGMINLQSLACGTPVVTTRSGAIPQYVGTGNGALIVAEHDSIAIAESVTSLLGNPSDIEKLGKKGRSYIEDRYEVKKNVQKCEEYVLKLLEKSTK